MKINIGSSYPYGGNIIIKSGKAYSYGGDLTINALIIKPRMELHTIEYRVFF